MSKARIASKHEVGRMRAPRKADLIDPARLGPAGGWLVRLIEYGTRRYDRETQRRLKILNVVAYLIALITLIYAIQQMFVDFQLLLPVIVLNLVIVAIALLVPFAHRFNDIAGALLIAVTEYIALFLFTLYLGRTSGVHIQYFATPAAFFVIFGLHRLRLILAFTAVGLVLHIAAWMLFPRHSALIPVDDAMLNSLYMTASFSTITMIAAVVYYAFRLAEDARGQTEALLRNILPDSIADRLTDKPDAVIADSFEEASVLFADLKGFVPLAKTLGPERTVGLLNEMMRSFDRLAIVHGVEKIKTIGDAYMVAAGVPEPVADHAPRLARMGLAMLQATAELAATFGVPLNLRIGIASGPLMAGVIGAKRLTYDVWGDTVNLASRLEGQSTPGRVLVASATKARLEGQFQLEPRGALDIRGLGEEEAWFLGAEEVSDPPGQTPARDITQVARSHGV
jgi:adenylate cyclase